MTADARPSRSSIPAPLAVLILVACLLAANLVAGGFGSGPGTDLAPAHPERPEVPASSSRGPGGDGTAAEAQDGGVGAVRPAG